MRCKSKISLKTRKNYQKLLFFLTDVERLTLNQAAKLKNADFQLAHALSHFFLDLWATQKLLEERMERSKG
jgi:hypothetical protein